MVDGAVVDGAGAWMLPIALLLLALNESYLYLCACVFFFCRATTAQLHEGHNKGGAQEEEHDLEDGDEKKKERKREREKERKREKNTRLCAERRD